MRKVVWSLASNSTYKHYNFLVAKPLVIYNLDLKFTVISVVSNISFYIMYDKQLRIILKSNKSRWGICLPNSNIRVSHQREEGSLEIESSWHFLYMSKGYLWYYNQTQGDVSEFVCLSVCMFVYLFVAYFLQNSWNFERWFPWVLPKITTIL